MSEAEHADLFWALRGGGGNFGVATSFELRLHPVGPIIYGGPLLWPAAEAPRILAAYADLCADLPDELSLFGGLIASPLDMEPVVAIVVGWFGPLDGADAAVAPVRALAPAVDLAGPIPYVALQSMLDESVPPGIPRYWKSGYFSQWPEPAIATAVAAAERKPTPMSVSCSSTCTAPSPASVRRRRPSPTATSPGTSTPSPSGPSRPTPRTESCGHAGCGTSSPRPATACTSTTSTPTTGTGSPRRTDRTSTGRLSVKQKYDPDNVFRLNHNIVPT